MRFPTYTLAALLLFAPQAACGAQQSPAAGASAGGPQAGHLHIRRQRDLTQCGMAAGSQGNLKTQWLPSARILEHWITSTWHSDNREHKVRNVRLTASAVQLRVDGNTPVDLPTVGAEISSALVSASHGMFCAILKTTRLPGTVTGAFYYAGDNNEIDIELLSGENAQGQVHFSVHRSTFPEHLHRRIALGFDPSREFHAYAFRWSAAGVEFFVDGVSKLKLPGRGPIKPGRLIINHWSGRFPNWGGGPPRAHAWLELRGVVSESVVPDGLPTSNR